MNYNDDTICAIATSLTPSGIGIIRISGKDATNIASLIFVNKNKKNIELTKSHIAHFGYIYDKNVDSLIDEVIVIPMLSPRSYTVEDVVEIQSHGNAIILKKILELLLENGARLAEPGEFTKRAFLNGRIDLTKAEAVADVISAKNEFALKASFNQLKGNLSDKIAEYKNIILEKIAYIEAALDDPEHIELTDFTPALKTDILEIIESLKKIIKNYDNGRIIKEGINTAIMGIPNVGKSSILNILLNEERAIVTDIAGTTRDTIKETINLNGISLNIIDTAGIRNENVDKIEKIGIEKSWDEAANSDLIIFILDASSPNKDSEVLYNDLKKLNKKTIILLNKIDLLLDDKNCHKNLESSLDNNVNNDMAKQTSNSEYILKIKNELKKEFPYIDFDNAILFSTKTKFGLDTLTNKIEAMFLNNEIDFNNEIYISNEREKQLLILATKSLDNVISSIDNRLSEDFLTIDLNDAFTSLKKVLGEEIDDDVVNEIFSKFCMGK